MQHATRLAGNRVSVCRMQTLFRSPTITTSCTTLISQPVPEQHRSLRGLVSFPASKYFSTTACHSAKRYTDKHEWVELATNQKEATVGISEYAQNSLGDIVFVQLPDVGNEVQKGSECGTVESVKAASDIYSPVTGTVLEKNTEVEEKPKLINKSPLDKGWLFKVELSDASEVDGLMEEKAYQQYLKSME